MIAALLLSPAALSATPGEEFQIAIVASAGTSTIGTIEARLSFDPSLLAAEQFSLARGWVAVEEPGLAALDNRKGVVVETAGYPGGFTGTTTLGTLTFKAEKPGTAKIVLAGASLMLDAAGDNAFAKAGGSVITIGGGQGAPAAGSRHAPAPAPPARASSPAPAPAPPLAAAAAAPASGLLAQALSWVARHLHF